MRKLALVILVVGLLALSVAFYPRLVEKPVVNGSGPMAVLIAPQFAAPEYHNPLDYWQTHHADMVNRGDLSQDDCLYCHVPDTSCNNCHNYVGAAAIIQTP